MRVRWATPQDARAIAEVHVASWLGGYRGIVADDVLDRVSVDQREEQWRRWLGDEARGSRTLLAGRGGRVEGFCSLAIPARGSNEGADVAEIPVLYVAPEAWRHGVGAALMSRALAEAEARGLRSAVVWVLDGNERAIRFYEALGWQLDGGRDEWAPADYLDLRLPVVSLRIELAD
jgi:GNAT superfamily N-acetyltransferase